MACGHKQRAGAHTAALASDSPVLTLLEQRTAQPVEARLDGRRRRAPLGELGLEIYALAPQVEGMRLRAAQRLLGR